MPRGSVLRFDSVVAQARVLFGDESIAQLRTHTGRLIDSAGSLSELDDELEPGFVVCLAADEQFVWPAMRPGESVRVRVRSFDDERTVTVHTLSTRPRVFVVPSFLTMEECDHLVQIASKMQMIKSKVGGDTGNGGEYRNVRTSSQTWIGPGSADDTPLVRRVRERVFDLMKMPEDLGEAMQLVQYDTTQHYLGHHDYAHKWESVNSLYVQGGGNRFITVIFYLNDVEEGGYTMFPFANSTNRPPVDAAGKELIWVTIGNEQVYYGNLGCDGTGLQVPPIKGTALIFYNLLEQHTVDAVPDSYTLHAGCDVLRGQKYMANIWIRNKRVSGLLY
jgi:hypothetical protein